MPEKASGVRSSPRAEEPGLSLWVVSFERGGDMLPAGHH